jgi:hypothetical protein
MFNYEYKEEAAKTLPTAGPAKFSVRMVYDKDREGQPLVSKSTGQPMLKLELFVTDSRGTKAVVYEHLTRAMGWKVKAIGDCLSLPSIYNASGAFNPNLLVGKEGQCLLKIENSGYGDKCVVEKYLPSGSDVPQTQVSPAATYPAAVTFNDDDIPF